MHFHSFTHLWLKALLALTLSSITALADTSDNFQYTDNGTDITIDGFMTSPSGGVVIPAMINGKPVTSIGDSAFANCGYLTGVTIPTSVTNIGTSAFYQCTHLINVTIPNNITRIGDSVFAYCSSLASVSIPSSVISIGNSAFTYCPSLTSIWIPTSVNSIGSQAFFGCSGLTNVSIPANITSIGDSAFSACTGLTSVTISANLTSIGLQAFYNCSALTSATFLKNTPVSIGSSVFDLAANNFSVYFQSGSSGFSSPTWLGYPASILTVSPLTSWLASHGISTTTHLLNTPNNDGLSLLVDYALNLDPTVNQSANMPKAVLAENQLTMSFYAGRSDVTYTVETSTDLCIWTTAGVTLSPPDLNGFVTASMPISEGTAFMMLRVNH